MIGGSLIDNVLGAKNTRDKGVPPGGKFSLPSLRWSWVAFPDAYRWFGFGARDALSARVLSPGKGQRQSLGSHKALAFGYGSAAIIRFVICLLMIGLWLLMVFFL